LQFALRRVQLRLERLRIEHVHELTLLDELAFFVRDAVEIPRDARDIDLARTLGLRDENRRVLVVVETSRARSPLAQDAAAALPLCRMPPAVTQKAGAPAQAQRLARQPCEPGDASWSTSNGDRCDFRGCVGNARNDFNGYLTGLYAVCRVAAHRAASMLNAVGKRYRVAAYYFS
jgi:hypothetical protein